MDFAPSHAVVSAASSREEIVGKYLHLVKYVAARISLTLPPNVEMSDLISDGVFGLIDAIDKYDESRAVKFETYAVTRINGAILDGLRSLDWVPRAVRQRLREVERACEKLEGELGRAPSDDELAVRLNVSTRELDRLRQRMRGTAVLSIEEPHVGDSLQDRENDITSEIERDELRAELVAAVASLAPPERTVIRRHYFNGEPLKAIKGALGVSGSRVSQIHARAVTHLRQRFEGALKAR